MPTITLQSVNDRIVCAMAQLGDHNTWCDGEAVFGVRSFLSAAALTREFNSNNPTVRFAEDDCGNFFVLHRNTGGVGFWDHETDEITNLAYSLDEFINRLGNPPDVELRPEQVIDAWIDPDFLRDQGGV